MKPKTEYRNRGVLLVSSRQAVAVLPVVVLVVIAVLGLIALSIFALRREPAPQPVVSAPKPIPSEPIAKTQEKQAPQQIPGTEKQPAEQQVTEPKREVVPEPKKTPERPPRRRAPGEPAITLGQVAPDFQLPRLTIETTSEGKSIGKISTETVKLSSFRGKKPVFLIFSSYT